MPISTDDFWKLAAASGLLPPERCRALQAEFAALKGAATQANARSLGEWLVATDVLTRYQVSVLASGRPGPFVFGDFVIIERIESGRLAKCFRARYKGAQLALLKFSADSAESPQQTRAMMDQVAAAREINSPHVAHVYQFQPTARPPFLVLEDLRGQSLHEARERGKPALSEACRIGFQAALGLVAMHEQRAVHGNLCPDNIWLDEAASVKLLHFPLAPLAWGETRLDPRLADYLAPELNDADRAPDALSDIYALGCVLYELISGRVPFPGGAIARKRASHASEVAERLDQFVTGVSEELADLVAEMLDKETLLRAATASHVANLLSPYTSDAAQLRKAMPPRSGPRKIAPGNAAGHDPDWQSPPKSAQANVPPASESPAASPSPRKPEQPSVKAAAPATPMAPTRPEPAKRMPKKPATSVAQPIAPTPAPQVAKVQSKAPDAGKPRNIADEVEPPRIIIDTQSVQPPLDSSAGAAALQPKSVNLLAIVAIAAAALLALAGLAAYFLLSDKESTVKRPIGAAVDGAARAADAGASTVALPQRESASNGSAPSSDDVADNTTLVDDDGTTLWVSPTAGAPLDVKYVPSSAQVLLALRPAELLAQDEGARLLAALGPEAEAARNQLQATLGVDLADVEQLLVAFAPNESGTPRTAYVARLARPIPQSQLLEAWGHPRATELAGQPCFLGGATAYCLPKADDGRVLLAASQAVLEETLGRNGPPLLRKGIEGLLRDSDRTRHLTLLAAPSYLLSDGRDLLAGSLSKLREPFERVFGMQTQAVLVSAHLGDELFLELRVAGPADVRPDKLAATLRGELDLAGEQVEQYVASITPQPYGRLIVNRFPRMLQLVGNFTRAAAEDRQAVLRCYLPLNAAHDLALGAELTLHESPGGTPAAQPTLRVGLPIGAEAELDRTVSLSFPRDTLEHSLEMLSAEIDTPIIIEGPDLQLEGITKNQSFTLDQRDQPARQILLAILKLANSDGKLVYVIRAGDGGAEAIHITTRAAAARRGESLPAVFAGKAPVKKS